jgi:Bacteriophage lambda head decoration protein D
MTNPLIEGQHTGEFLVSEANGTLSREAGTLAQRSEPYKDGTILGISGENYVALEQSTGVTTEDPDGDIVAANVKGILYGNYDASAGAVKCVVIARLAEVDLSLLVMPEGSTEDAAETAGQVIAGLALLNIRTR